MPTRRGTKKAKPKVEAAVFAQIFALSIVCGSLRSGLGKVGVRIRFGIRVRGLFEFGVRFGQKDPNLPNLLPCSPGPIARDTSQI